MARQLHSRPQQWRIIPAQRIAWRVAAIKEQAMKPYMVAQKVRDGAAVASGAARSPWLEKLARFGYAVRGVLYATVGLLALEVALGQGGATTDKGGAIETIGSQPFGKFLLVLVIVGLIGYSLWGGVRA